MSLSPDDLEEMRALAARRMDEQLTIYRTTK